ncbi:hypothetical protein C0993_012154 [Termitomyces sp. T159_Od127]|nr:hypothetical protein C0993_012154 [Termitomyces sp. T159_Od127]
MGKKAKSGSVGAGAGEEGTLHSKVSGDSGSGDESSRDEEEALALFIKVEPPHGRARELAVAKGKWQVSPSLEAKPSKRLQGDVLMASPPDPHTFLLWLAHSTPNPSAAVSCRAVLLPVMADCKLLALNLMLCQQIEKLLRMVVHQEREA